MGYNMKKTHFIKILSAIMSVLMLCGVFSPAIVSATSNNAYASGLQKFLDDGNHTQLVDCPDAVYMDYAELLRTDSVAVHTMHLLGLIYGGLSHDDRIEPDKELYKQALLNIIRTYEAENAEAITQQNLLDDTKSLEDYLHDVADIGLSWLGAVDTNIKLETGEGVIPEDVSLAVSIINQIPKNTEDWAKGACTLKTTLQLYEKHDIFLRTVEENAEGTLKEAASELRTDQSKVVKAHLRAYGDLVMDSAEDYAKLFVDGIWAEDWIDYIKDKLPFSIPKVFSSAFQGAALGVEIGKLVGNLSVGAEDVMAYIVEIKAVHDISIIIENEMNSIKDTFQKDSSKVTEADVQDYIAYGNYLISSRVRGQYCMTAIYLQPQMQKWLKNSDIENAQLLYNRLSSTLLDIKINLDAINAEDRYVTSPIIDAVNYSKKVELTQDLAAIGYDVEGLINEARLPKLSSETANAEAFNQKLYNTFSYQYERLLNNQEGGNLLKCDYEYKQHNGVVGIVIKTNVGAWGAGANSYYYAFYYDFDQDKELTFDEYLEAIGIEYDLLTSRVKNTSIYKDFYSYVSEYNNVYIKDCILDENASIVYMNDSDTMMGWNRLDVESLLQ